MNMNFFPKPKAKSFKRKNNFSKDLRLWKKTDLHHLNLNKNIKSKSKLNLNFLKCIDNFINKKNNDFKTEYKKDIKFNLKLNTEINENSSPKKFRKVSQFYTPQETNKNIFKLVHNSVKIFSKNKSNQELNKLIIKNCDKLLNKSKTKRLIKFKINKVINTNKFRIKKYFNNIYK